MKKEREKTTNPVKLWPWVPWMRRRERKVETKISSGFEIDVVVMVICM